MTTRTVKEPPTTMLDTNTTIRNIVADDFRAASVFERHGIDFCCGGNRPVAEACRELGVSQIELEAELRAVLAPSQPGLPRFNSWDLDVLTGYIVGNHHGYVRQAIPGLLAHARKVADVHGERHPEVKAIAEYFESVAADLAQHMAREEQVLFPYINGLAAAGRGGAMPIAPFGSVANPIRMMEAEHQAAGDAMASIRKLSGGYVPPADACTTFTVAYQELQAFEADLHQHVHLENNILFPKALELERGLREERAARDRPRG
jgi:regulator of cell morphogenesis and NO signaling